MKRIFNGSGGRKAALILSLCLIDRGQSPAFYFCRAHSGARSSPKMNTATVPGPAGRFLLFSVLTSAPCAVRRRRS